MTAAHDIARAIRLRVPSWREERPAEGLWIFGGVCEWAGTEIIIEGRVRRIRPLWPAKEIGPTIDAYARSTCVSIRIDLPVLVDKSDVSRVLTALEAIGALPPVAKTDSMTAAWLARGTAP